MSHPSSGALLELHFDECTAAERGALSAHVRDCRPCEARLAEWSRLERALAPAPDDGPPADGLERVLSRVAVLRRPRTRRAEWARAAAPSVAALLAAAWATRAGAERLAALGLAPGWSLGPFPGEVVAVAVAAAGIATAGALVTLALAPVLILESQGRS